MLERLGEEQYFRNKVKICFGEIISRKDEKIVLNRGFFPEIYGRD